MVGTDDPSASNHYLILLDMTSLEDARKDPIQCFIDIPQVSCVSLAAVRLLGTGIKLMCFSSTISSLTVLANP